MHVPSCVRRITSAGLLLAATSWSATVSVDLSTTYQTIDGFGVFGGMNVWWSPGPFYDENFLNLLIDTLGVTILRTELYPQPEQTELYTKQIPFLRAVKAKAEASGEPMKFVASIWTPPARFKTPQSTIGGTLNPSQAGAFGDYLVDYARKFKTDIGTDLYALSPQNEPGLGTGYNSCVIDPQPLGDMIIAVSQKFKAGNVQTRIHYPDNIWWGGGDWTGQALSWVCKDPVADSVASILSVHYSADNDQSSVNDNTWLQKIAEGGYGPWGNYRSVNVGKKMTLWNTEFGGDADTWGGGRDAFQYAKNMWFCMNYGYSAVVYWIIATHTNPDQVDESLMPSRKMGPKAFVAKSFYRYIRPGAVRTKATSSDAGIWCLAFKHDQQKTATVVMVNTNATEQTVTISGAGLPSQLTVYQTSPTQNCINKGTVAPGGSVTLPVKSITTLYNSSSSAIRHQIPSAVAVTGQEQSRSGLVYRLDGRLMSRVRGEWVKNMRPGVYCRISERGAAGGRMMIFDR